jgi:hypothetical protein
MIQSFMLRHLPELHGSSSAPTQRLDNLAPIGFIPTSRLSVLPDKRTEPKVLLIQLEEAAMARPSRRKRKSAKKTSRGSALDEIGFKPLGRRVKIKAGINQTQLRKPLSANASGERRD